MPLFSVVTPVYNREELIENTLGSIFAQGYGDLDVIVVDDGSTDDTLAKLKSFEDRIRIFQQENKGPGAARNVGIREAEGDYIAFLDSDDLWFPWTLETYEKLIRKYDRPAFIGGCPYQFSSIEEIQEVERPSLEVMCFADYYSSGDAWRWWGVSSFVIRTDALRAVGGFTDCLINGEDADLAMKMGTAPGFVDVSSGPTFAYREHDAQLMDSVRKNATGASYIVEQEHQGRYPGGNERRLERWQILSRHVRPASLACLEAGFLDQGWELYRKTLHWSWVLRRWKYLIGFPIRAAQCTLS